MAENNEIQAICEIRVRRANCSGEQCTHPQSLEIAVKSFDSNFARFADCQAFCGHTDGDLVGTERLGLRSYTVQLVVVTDACGENLETPIIIAERDVA